MNFLKKDLQNVLFSFGAVFLCLAVGAYTYYSQDGEPLNIQVVTPREEIATDDQVELDSKTIIIATTTELVVPVPVPVAETSTNFSGATAKQIADQKAAEEKVIADAAKKAADEKALAEALLAADALAKQLAAEEKAIADAAAAEKAAADAAAVKKSRKSRAS